MILNSDREDEGFLEGLRQARAGEHKDHRTKGLLKAALLPFDHSHQSYMNGLNRGFEEGLKERELQHKVTFSQPPSPASSIPVTPSSTTMRDTTGYQLDALANLQGFLDGLASTLSEAAQQYHQFVAGLGDSGMVERIVHRYEQEFMTPNLHHIRSLIDRIQSEDIPYIRREIDHMDGTGHQ
jgi:hypothetical protein